ncbi:MFS transporter [Aquabacter spiritensis]|uniref:Putative MFS family arabinose efflux permease n=1 Tax=Aquabacter spiritensis TaxID=933073 RepID=A0A4R3M9A5_9HYPH|nr:MFS transporter [Aquabacter spiritensis]TCT08287.1 putative MFS family arabinose efflux permease [Aquabacter spiritensis]
MDATTSTAVPTAPGRPRAASALGGLNFFLADVRDGLGPFLGIFLLGQGWAPDEIGFAMTAGGLAGMLAAGPLGALADATRAKRGLIAACAVAVIIATLALLAVPTLPVTLASQIFSGLAGAAIGPALAALTLGLVGQDRLPTQLGRNEAFNHAGNMSAAVLAGGLGYAFGITAVFWLMAAMAAGSLLALLFIRPGDIDHDVARGLEPGDTAHGRRPPGFRALIGSGPLLAVGFTLLLFHLGNAAMLPLLGQAIAAKGEVDPAAYTAATVVIAQLTMIPMALIAARIARTHGYFLVFLAALVALPVRGLIAGLWASPYALVPVQILDGVGAGLLGVATPGIVARILRGSGHVNAGLGGVMTLQGAGAALSPALAGMVAARFGYGAAFLVLAGAAGAALALWLICAPRSVPVPAASTG